jgi:hypothetical protein
MYINQLKINKLKKELEILKEDYAKMIVKSYKSRSEQSRAMFILSSENFLQAYKRAQYMKQYTSFRKTQGEEIKSKTNQLIVYNEKLDIQKIAKNKLIAENEKERLSLLKEKNEQEKNYGRYQEKTTGIKSHRQTNRSIDSRSHRRSQQKSSFRKSHGKSQS